MSFALSLTLKTGSSWLPNPEGFLQGRQVGLQYMTDTGRLSWSSWGLCCVGVAGDTGDEGAIPYWWNSGEENGFGGAAGEVYNEE